MLNRLHNFNLRYKYLGFIFALAIAALGIFTGPSLPLRLSLTDLLPDQRESVLDMRAVEKEFGGIGYLIVLLGPMNNPESALPQTLEIVRTIPDVKYVFHEREQFLLRDRALQILPKTEIRKLTKHAQTLFGDGETNSGGIDLGLEDESTREEEIEEAKQYFREFREKHVDTSRYFVSRDGRYAMLLAKPNFDSEDLARSTLLVDAATKALDDGLRGIAPYRLVGRYVDKVRDTKQINYDIYRTGLISMTGIAIVLIWGLGALRGAFVTLAGVIISMGWTVGIAKLMVGQINILTGFLLAILSGLGVEYGVHLIRRYYQERAMGHEHATAVSITYHHIGRALFSAAVTSAAAFLILSFSDFRGFSELGKVAGFGVLSIYAVYMLCFPLVGDFLRTKPRFGRTLEVFGYYPFSSRWSWIFVPTVVLTVVGMMRAEFEYDFERMHDLSKETLEMNHLAQELFGRSVSPAALLAKDPEQAAALYEWLLEDERKPIVQDAVSLYTLMPLDQEWRADRIEKLRKAVAQVPDAELREKIGVSPKQVQRWLAAKPLTLDEIPPQLRENFGKSGNIVIAYPRENLDHADSLRRFSEMMIEAKQKFPGLRIGSDARIFVEILDHIVDDGRIVLLIFLIGAFFVFWLDFRNVYDAALLEAQLVAGIALLIAAMGLVNVRFSILNVAMVPAVLAAGIDIGVHVRHREKEGFRALASARFVAQAVQLSAITTIIGFGALFFAEAGMLKGIAWISVLGQLSMYFICMVFAPIFRDFLWRRKERAKVVPKDIVVEGTVGD